MNTRRSFLQSLAGFAALAFGGRAKAGADLARIKAVAAPLKPMSGTRETYTETDNRQRLTTVTHDGTFIVIRPNYHGPEPSTFIGKINDSSFLEFGPFELECVDVFTTQITDDVTSMASEWQAVEGTGEIIVRFKFKRLNHGTVNWIGEGQTVSFDPIFDKLIRTGPGYYSTIRFQRECKGKRVYLDGVDVTKEAFESNIDQGWVRRFKKINGDFRWVMDSMGKHHVDRYTTFGKVEIRDARDIVLESLNRLTE